MLINLLNTQVCVVLEMIIMWYLKLIMTHYLWMLMQLFHNVRKAYQNDYAVSKACNQ